MGRELQFRRLFRRAAAAGAVLAGALVAAAALTPAAAQTFYVFTTNEPGKVDGIDTTTATGTPLLPVVPSPTTKLMDVATQQLTPVVPTDPTQQLWGIRNTAGSNPAAIYTITAGVSAQVALLSGDAALQVNGQGPNALVIDPTSGIMYTAASQTGFIYEVCYLTGGPGCGVNPLGFATQVGTVGYGTDFTVQSTGASITGATVTSAGDLEFLDGILYATLFVSTGGGPSNNQTYLATIDLNPGPSLGAATLIGLTNVGTNNIRIDGLALGFDGTLWGTNASNVYTINTTTGALTLKYTISGLGSVGATGFAVAEPATLALFGTGLAGLWAARRRMRRAA